MLFRSDNGGDYDCDDGGDDDDDDGDGDGGDDGDDGDGDDGDDDDGDDGDDDDDDDGDDGDGSSHPKRKNQVSPLPRWHLSIKLSSLCCPWRLCLLVHEDHSAQSPRADGTLVSWKAWVGP